MVKKNLNSKTVLVTGGFGFIGSCLVKTLINKNNIHVVNIDNLSYAANVLALEGVDKEKHTHIKENISDFGALVDIFNKYKPETVYHLAAESHVDRSIEMPSDFINTNIFGTFNLLSNSYEYWSKSDDDKKERFKFMYISTDEVYGSIEDGHSSEVDMIKPSSPYSASKASGDMLVYSWNKTYKLPTLITRCSNNYGPWQFPEKLIPLTIYKALNQKQISVYGNGKQVRDWIYVQDHVDALIALAESNDIAAGEIYNISAENEKTNLDLIKMICSFLNEITQDKNSDYEKLIKFVQDRPGHDFRYALKSNKIRSSVGWSPQTPFEEGLKQTVKWYVNNLNNLLSTKNEKFDGNRIGILGKDK